MKKTLIIVFIAFCIFQMIVLATANIDIGSVAEDGNLDYQALYTIILKDNPANESGTITSIEVFAHTNISDFEVATFEEVSTNVFTTRDTHTIGAVTAGSKQTFSGLDITVSIGDYIGFYFSAGTIERTSTGGAGYWYVGNADHIPCTSQAFSLSGNTTQRLSLYGIGVTAGITWNNVTMSKWNTKTISKWNNM